MRVAMILEKPLFFGGAETHAYELSKQLLKLGYEVDFIQMHGSPRKRTLHENEKMKPSSWIPAPKSKYLNAFYARLLWFYGYLAIPFIFREIRKGQYEVLHIHGFGYSCNLIAAYLAKSNSEKIVCTLHNDTALHIDRKIIKRLASSVDTFIAVSKAMQIKWFDAYDREPCFIPNGVDSDRFSPKVDGSEIRHRLGLKNRFVVLSLSRLSPQKGLEYLIRAVAQLREKNLDFTVLICGTGEQEGYLKRLTKALEVEDYVRFLGYVPSSQLPELYAACDVFILPSNFEVFSLTLLEAISSGKQVISSDTAVPRESAHELEEVCDAKIIKSRNATEIANAILDCYKNRQSDFTIKKAVIRHEYVMKKYSWQKIAKEIDKLYCQISSRKQ